MATERRVPDAVSQDPAVSVSFGCHATLSHYLSKPTACTLSHTTVIFENTQSSSDPEPEVESPSLPPPAAPSPRRTRAQLAEP